VVHVAQVVLNSLSLESSLAGNTPEANQLEINIGIVGRIIIVPELIVIHQIIVIIVIVVGIIVVTHFYFPFLFGFTTSTSLNFFSQAMHLIVLSELLRSNLWDLQLGQNVISSSNHCKIVCSCRFQEVL
jgi:hypothetical protein